MDIPVFGSRLWKWGSKKIACRLALRFGRRLILRTYPKPQRKSYIQFFSLNRVMYRTPFVAGNGRGVLPQTYSSCFLESCSISWIYSPLVRPQTQAAAGKEKVACVLAVLRDATRIHFHHLRDTP